VASCEQLNGASIEEVREKFVKMTEDEETYPNGLDVDLCLMVGEKEVRSLLDAEVSKVLFAIGVAKELSDDSEGVFKIAVDILIPDVWYLLSVITPGEARSW
jgi:hypothetical protein